MNTMIGSYRLSGYRAIIRILASNQALEAKASLFAIAFGAMLAAVTKSLLHASVAKGLVNFDPATVTFGALICVLGIIGLYGLLTRRKTLRLISAAGLTFCWAWIVLFYLLTVPPLPNAIVVHSTASLVEAWIFLRVKHDLDYWR